MIRLQAEIQFLKRDLCEVANKRKEEAESFRAEMQRKV